MLISVSDKIMWRVNADGRGKKVYTQKDFSDLGGPASVAQALSSLCKDGSLRLVSDELYDFPRLIPSLNRQAPPTIDAIICALKRKYEGIIIVPDGIVAANKLGLTNAVAAKTIYITDRISEDIPVGDRTICLKQATGWLISWLKRPSGFVIQALNWLGEGATGDKKVISTLQARLTDDLKQDLIKDRMSLPAWINKIIDQVCLPSGCAAT